MAGTASAARMAYIQGLASKAVRRGRCVGCREYLKDGVPVVCCGPRRFLCADCSNAKRPATCRCCRRRVTDMFFYRVKYTDKPGLICADCREKSKLEGVSSVCRGCLSEIPAGDALVYCGILRCVCAQCAAATRPFYCKGCHRTLAGVFAYLHLYAGNQRNVVCEWCSTDIETGVRCSQFATQSEVAA